jgi:hypothetical protein
VGVQWSAAHTLEIFQGESELSQNFVVWNTLATVEGSTRGGDLASFFLRDRLIVNGRVGETVSQGISHHLEQVNDGGELASIELIEELVCLLFFVCGCHQE